MDVGKQPILLVVDDTGTWLTRVMKLGEEMGFFVLTAAGGNMAMNLLDKYPEITAVITDVQMQPVDGMEILQFLFRCETQPKTLVHSSEQTYRPRGGEVCDLEEWVTKYFGEFARFALKSPDLAAQHAFLEEVLAARQ